MNGLRKIGETITAINDKIAFVAALFIYPVIAVIVIEVCGRYFFNSPTNWSYDSSWMFYGLLVFLGGAYGMSQDVHVKADIVYDLLKPRAKAIVRIFCYITLFFPFAIGLMYSSSNLMIKAWQTGEISPYTSWNPATGPIKTILFISAVMIFFQGCVEFGKYIKMLKDGGDRE